MKKKRKDIVHGIVAAVVFSSWYSTGGATAATIVLALFDTGFQCLAF